MMLSVTAVSLGKKDSGGSTGATGGVRARVLKVRNRFPQVSEVRRRASNQSTEMASSAIAQFLEVSASPNEPASRGWLLLTAINLLAGAGPRVVEALASQALPSTLVKCLYLFFDLPPLKDNKETSAGAETIKQQLETTEKEVNSNNAVVSQQPSESISNHERRILLQKVSVVSPWSFASVNVSVCVSLAVVPPANNYLDQRLPALGFAALLIKFMNELIGL